MERLKKIRINPIVKKDLRVLSRSMKIAWGIFAYEAVLLVVFLFAIWIIFDEMGGYGYSSNYQSFVTLFPMISALEFGIIALLMPIMTATAVSGEKERQTFDILLTTVMTPRAIIRGKVGSAVIRVMVFMIGSIPLMALSFTLGGLSWSNLFITMIAFLLFAILTGSFGIFASTLTRKSITAIILTYVFYFVFINVTAVPTLIINVSRAFGGSSGSTSILLLFNPVAAIIELFVMMLGGENLFGGSALGWMSGWVWLIVSGVIMFGFSLLFQELAARRIDPLFGYVSNTNKKQLPGMALNTQQMQQPVPANWAPQQIEQPQPGESVQQPLTSMQDPAATMQQTVAPMQETAAEETSPIAPITEPIAPIQEPIAPVTDPIAPIQEPIAPVQEPIFPVQTAEAVESKEAVTQAADSGDDGDASNTTGE